MKNGLPAHEAAILQPRRGYVRGHNLSRARSGRPSPGRPARPAIEAAVPDVGSSASEATRLHHLRPSQGMKADGVFGGDFWRCALARRANIFSAINMLFVI